MKHRWYPGCNRTAAPLRRVVASLAVLGVGAAGLAVAPSASAAAPAMVTDPASHVNTLAGTGTGGSVVGSINNFPGASVPFGMVQFSPDNPSTGQGYYYDNSTLRGFGMNHASQGCGAFGDFPVLPTTVSVASPAHPWEKTNSYTHDGEVGQAGYYKLVSKDDNGVSITSELTSTTRTGLATFTFPAGTTDPKVTLRSGASNTSPTASGLTVNPNTGIVTGYTKTGRFCGQANSYTVYFAASFEQAFSGYGAWNEYDAAITPGDGTHDATVSGTSTNTRAGGYVQFPSGTTTVRMRIALSYVSTDNAIENMQTEVPTVSAAAFDSVRQAAHDTWNDYLGKAEISESTQADTTTFYTLLYRSLLHPNTFEDVNGDYIGFESTPQVHNLADTNAANGQHQEHQYATFSDWDTYRSLAPLHALLYPKEASDMAQSLVNDGEQAGSFPMWPMANASTGQMSGDNSSALIAQVYAYGARDFDTATALQIMVDNSTGAKTGLYTGGTNTTYIEREGGLIYNQRKYAPQLPEFQTDHAVTGASITLEWSIDDFAIGQFAKALDPTGNAALADEYQDRSNYWQNMFNPTTKFVSPRDDAGQFPDGDGNTTPSDFGYRGHVTGYGQVGFDEGMAEQYLWLVPQNIAGLTKVLGGREKTADRLDRFMTHGYNVGANQPYMWAGNEPNFQTPWVYNYLGQPWRTQEVVDDIRSTLFGPNPHGGEPGNDDLGAQASWYVWAALGIYPTTPGTDILTVNTPMTDKAVITMGNGKKLTITADGASSGKRYIRGLAVDGKAVNATYLPDHVLDQDATVDFTVGRTPSTSWGTSLDAAPPSFGTGSNDFVANASPSKASLEAGSTTDLAVDVQQIAGTSSTFTVAVDGTLPAGFSVTGTGTGTFAKDGSGHLALPLTVSSGVASGYYDVALKVTSGATTVTTTQSFTVARPGSLLAAQTIVGTAPQSAPSGNFDGAGNTYSRDQLALLGLTPGATKALSNGTTLTWPTSPVGRPDTVAPNGQTIVLDKPASTISFVGAGINAGGTNTATVTYDDGGTGSADFSFGDWVKPSSTGNMADGTLQPVYGNTVVGWTPVRNANSTDPGAYIFATTPFTAPTGKKIVSVTLPTTNKARIFTIAQDAASLAASAGTAGTTSAAAVPAAPSTTAATAGTSATSAAVTGVDGAATTLRSLRVKGGKATKKAKNHRRAPVVVKASKRLTDGTKARGKVKVYAGKKAVRTVRLAAFRKGKVTVTLPKRFSSRAAVTVRVRFVPSKAASAEGATAVTSKPVKVRTA